MIKSQRFSWLVNKILLLAILCTCTDVCIGQLTTTFTRPVQETDVATSESGVIVESFVEEGSTVHKGQILAKLNDSTLREARRLAESRASSTVRVRATASSLEIKKTHAMSLKELLDKGHGNQREVDLANLQLEAAIAEHELAIEQKMEAEIELAKIEAELEMRVIRSPMDGTVSVIFKEPGEYIAANDPVFCTIVRTDKLRADFYLDRRLFQRLKENTVFKIKILENANNPTESIVPADLVFRSPTFDPKSETARVSLQINNPNNAFLSGCKCELIIEGDSISVRKLEGRVESMPLVNQGFTTK